jgi:hypothetical protein
MRGAGRGRGQRPETFDPRDLDGEALERFPLAGFVGRRSRMRVKVIEMDRIIMN